MRMDREPDFVVSSRKTPTCGRDDCDPADQPEHWVDVELSEPYKKLRQAARLALDFHKPEGRNHPRAEVVMRNLEEALGLRESKPKEIPKPLRPAPKFKGCEVCGQVPIIVESGMCGVCTYGTADALGEGEYIEVGS